MKEERIQAFHSPGIKRSSVCHFSDVVGSVQNDYFILTLSGFESKADPFGSQLHVIFRLSSRYKVLFVLQKHITDNYH